MTIHGDQDIPHSLPVRDDPKAPLIDNRSAKPTVNSTDTVDGHHVHKENPSSDTYKTISSIADSSFKQIGGFFQKVEQGFGKTFEFMAKYSGIDTLSNFVFTTGYKTLFNKSADEMTNRAIEARKDKKTLKEIRNRIDTEKTIETDLKNLKDIKDKYDSKSFFYDVSKEAKKLYDQLNPKTQSRIVSQNLNLEEKNTFIGLTPVQQKTFISTKTKILKDLSKKLSRLLDINIDSNKKGLFPESSRAYSDKDVSRLLDSSDILPDLADLAGAYRQQLRNINDLLGGIITNDILDACKNVNGTCNIELLAKKLNEPENKERKELVLNALETSRNIEGFTGVEKHELTKIIGENLLKPSTGQEKLPQRIFLDSMFTNSEELIEALSDNTFK